MAAGALGHARNYGIKRQPLKSRYDHVIAKESPFGHIQNNYFDTKYSRVQHCWTPTLSKQWHQTLRLKLLGNMHNILARLLARSFKCDNNSFLLHVQDLHYLHISLSSYNAYKLNSLLTYMYFQQGFIHCSSIGRASHQYRGGHGFKSRWSLRVFSGFYL